MQNGFDLESVHELKEFKKDTRRYEAVYKISSRRDPSFFSIYYLFYANDDHPFYSLKEVPYDGKEIYREGDVDDPNERLSKDYDCLDELHRNITGQMNYKEMVKNYKFEDYRSEEVKENAYLDYLKIMISAKFYGKIHARESSFLNKWV